MAYPFTKPQTGLNGLFRDLNYEDPDRLIGRILDVQSGFQTVTFAATINPDWSLGTKVICTLTNNITIGSPVADVVAGTQVQFYLIQDGTGTRTVAYSGKMKGTGVAAVTTTASTYTIDTFIFDGTNYRIVSRVTAQTA